MKKILSKRYKKIFNKKKILITGNTGFKGSWLTLWMHYLGANVIGISKNIPTDPSHYKLIGLDKKIKTIKLDIPLECTYEGVVMWMDLISIFKSDRILRSKSILNINGKPAILESVRQVFHPIRYLKKWPYKNKMNKLFFVCQNDIGIEEIKKSLDCLSIIVKKNSSSKLIDVNDFSVFKNLFSKQSAYK